MKPSKHSSMRLYSTQGDRLYINGSERKRIEKAAHKRPEHIKLFCLILLYTGCRITEARNLTKRDFQFKEGVISINSLKKRNKSHVREIPVPKHLMKEVKSYLSTLHKHPEYQPWNVHRGTAWKWVKKVMKEANISGIHASPKGLRHGFGVHAIMCDVALSVLQKWLGHSSIKTTTIYTQVVGKEERKLAERMW